MFCDCKFKFAFRDKTHCPKCNKEIMGLNNPRYFIQSYYYNNKKKKAGLKYKSISEQKITDDLVKFVVEDLQIPSPLLEYSDSPALR